MKTILFVVKTVVAIGVAVFAFAFTWRLGLFTFLATTAGRIILMAVLLASGGCLWRLFRQKGRTARTLIESGTAPALLLLFALYWLPYAFGVAVPSHTPKESFNGVSSGLKMTQVVATLDTPIEDGANAVWCASFQMAWDALRKDKLEGEPVRLAAAQDFAERLNAFTCVPEALPADIYAKAGCVSDGIIEQIRKETAERFPDAKFELADGKDLPPDAALVAYGFLQASAQFRLPYNQIKDGVTFTGANGEKKHVGGFGIREEDVDTYRDLRKQIEVLFADYGLAHPDWKDQPKEYAVDISLGIDTQLVLAVVPKAASLADTVDYVRAKQEAFREDGLREFGMSETLAVPEMNWRIEHRFSELEGSEKVLLNDIDCGGYLGEARQEIQFRLDRCGTRLQAEARVVYQSMPPRHLVFDRPFLLVMQRRGAPHPYFVMWVDNPELLS